MRHEYTCNNKDSGCTGHFTTDFAPVYDPPAHCPKCGNDEHVTYIGETENHAKKFEVVNEYLRKLYDARKSPLKYALSDLSDWLETDLDRVCTLLDELQNDVEGVR